MKLKLLFVVGLAVGYLLGARAGRAKYDELKGKANDAWEDPRVQRVVTDAQEFVKENAPLVQDRVVAGTKAAVVGVQDGYVKATETAKEVSSRVADTAKEVTGKVVDTAHDVTGKVVETAHDVTEKVVSTAHDVTGKVVGTAHELRERASGRGDDVVDSVLVAVAKARDGALEDDNDDDAGR